MAPWLKGRGVEPGREFLVGGRVVQHADRAKLPLLLISSVSHDVGHL